MIRFYARSSTRDDAERDVWGPCTVDAVQAQLDAGQLEPLDELRRDVSGLWAPIVAWTAFDLEPVAPARARTQRGEAPTELVRAFLDEGDLLRWWWHDGERIRGPFDGAELRRVLDGGRTSTANATAGARGRESSPGAGGGAVCLVGRDAWWPARTFTSVPPLLHAAERQPDSLPVEAYGQEAAVRCAVCCELVPAESALCPDCGEPVGGPEGMDPPSVDLVASSRAAGSLDATARASWLRLHWRPVTTIGVIGCLIGTGIALRHLAPERYMPPRRINPAPAAGVCESACWHGEACQMGQCVWQPPNDVGHVSPKPLIAGPFVLPPDMVDVLPLDSERFAVSCLKGVEIYGARTGEELSLVSDAPQAQSLYRTGTTFYATSPQRIYVIDVETTRVLKTIEIGSAVHDMAIGAMGQRALASIPGARSVAVIATDYHAEVNRFYFGDDAVGPVAIDDTGNRGLTSTGRTPLPGLRGPQGGALYAFDPSRLASEQDRVRAAMVGNPVQIVMAPDGETSFVVLREADRLVPLQHLPSGAVLRSEPITTCRQPEQLGLVPKGRRGVVRCNEGRALEILDLPHRKLLRHVPLNAWARDMVISPDGRQVVAALSNDRTGSLALLDLDTYQLTVSELAAEPHRVRIAPDGRMAVVVSDRAKVAWVVR
jgi:DNA-binding beta-propeller fold protein YncE